MRRYCLRSKKVLNSHAMIIAFSYHGPAPKPQKEARASHDLIFYSPSIPALIQLNEQQVKSDPIFCHKEEQTRGK